MEKKHVVAAAIILALLAGGGWALFSGEDQEFVSAKQKRDELFKKADTMSPEERRAEFGALREQTREFSEEQRREFGRGMQQFMMQRVDKLLAMPKEQQRAELDKWIDRMEEMRQNREAQGDQGREGRGRDRGRDMSVAERDQRRKQRLDRSTPEMRAQRDAMRDLINDRRAERGLEPMQGGGRGMFGGGRGGPR